MNCLCDNPNARVRALTQTTSEYNPVQNGADSSFSGFIAMPSIVKENRARLNVMIKKYNK